MLPNPIDWCLEHLPRMQETNSAQFLYDRFESQSDYGLPIIYCPFDGRKLGHFVDRGQILDFSHVAGPGRVLDFGPGDGWPSLTMAPFLHQVVGVDASAKRVAVCRENAARMEIGNVEFLHVPAGERLPFEDASFDGATAASSVEQTPDPQATLRELVRVLKPGARLRLRYESLGRYRDGKERELGLGSLAAGQAFLVLYERHCEEERVRHLGLVLDRSPESVAEALELGQDDLHYQDLSRSRLEILAEQVVEAGIWTTRHPSCRTWLQWLLKAGFSRARSTEDGGQVAAHIYNALDPEKRPRQIEAVDALLTSRVRHAIERKRPCARLVHGLEPTITAVR